MISRIKIQSIESGIFNGVDKFLANFTIPPDGVYDLSQSSLSLKTKIKALDADKTAATGKHNVSLLYRPQCLVENCQLKTSKLGILEDLRSRNVLAANLENYVYSEQSLNDNAVVNGTRYTDHNNKYWTAFMDHDEVELRVPLPNLFPGMAIQQYPANRVGPTNIEIEFQNPYNATILQENNVYADEEVHFDNVVDTAVDYITSKDYLLAFSPYEVGDKVTLFYTDDTDVEKEVANEVDAVAQQGLKLKITMKTAATENQNNIFTLEDGLTGGISCVNVGAPPAQKLTLKGHDLDASQTGLWVGQHCNIVFKEGAVTNTVKAIVITDNVAEVEFNAGTDATDTIPNPATNPHISEVAANNLAYEISQPSLILYKLNVTPQQANKMNMSLKRGVNLAFRTWSLETVNMDGVAQYNRQFFLEPGTSNALLLFVIAPDLNSTQPILDRFRCVLNGIDLTTTDIIQNTPLYKDRLMYTMANVGAPIVNLNREGLDAYGNFIIANPIPFLDEQQMFSIKLNALSGQTLDGCVIYLFKQVNRVLRI